MQNTNHPKPVSKAHSFPLCEIHENEQYDISEISPRTHVLNDTMSGPGSNDTSRSASPSTGGVERSRMVSGSLKDRIAKFNNPDAAPLLPSHPFGSAGPAGGPGPAQRGLYGNRIPGIDPKSAGHIAGLGIGRKPSEGKGLIGNRIPSASTSGNNIASLASLNIGGSGKSTPPQQTQPVGDVPPPVSASARSASPEGSINSSTASGAQGTGSPATSRSSSPPTSHGDGEFPSSLLSATLPDIGGPGAMTPSSTRAEAGEETTDFSAPTTPVVTAQSGFPAPEYDLVPGNLKLAAGMSRGLSSTSNPRSFAPSVTSSLASQYDPSSQGGEEKQMMQDVSGISTPMGTPRAANREFEGSARGEGSVVGEGDLDDVRARLDELSVTGVPDRDPTPEPPKDKEALSLGSLGDLPEPEDTPTPSQEMPEPSPIAPEDSFSQADTPPVDESDPNEAADLDSLKHGDLHRDSQKDGLLNQNPIDNIAQQGMKDTMAEEPVPLAEQKQQGGAAGQQLDDVWNPDQVISPSSAGDSGADGAGFSQGGVGVESVSASTETETGKTKTADETKPDTSSASSISDARPQTGHSPNPAIVESDSDYIDPADREIKPTITETIQQGLQEIDQPEIATAPEHGEDLTGEAPKVHGILGGREHVGVVSPGEPSALDKIGVGQSTDAEERRKEIILGMDEKARLNYPQEDDEMREYAKKDKREGKTLVGELARMAKDEGVEMRVDGEKVEAPGVPVPSAGEDDGVKSPSPEINPDARGDNQIPNPFKSAHGSSATFTTKKETPRGSVDSIEGLISSSANGSASDLTGGAASGGEKVEAASGTDEQEKEKNKGTEDVVDVDAGDSSRALVDEEKEAKGDTKPLQVNVEPAPLAQSEIVAEEGNDVSAEVASDATDVSSQATERGSIASPVKDVSPGNVERVPDSPVALKPEDAEASSGNSLIAGDDQPSFKPDADVTPLADTDTSAAATLSLPTPPETDPDEADPIHSVSAAASTTASGRSTPLDPAFLKSFPAVPDEEHPRVEVHLSPHATPVKGKSTGVGAAVKEGEGEEGGDDERERARENATPERQRASSSSSLEVDDPLATVRLKKRGSTRRSPKSPALGDDEDPGDWVPGKDGWATVIKGRET